MLESIKNICLWLVDGVLRHINLCRLFNPVYNSQILYWQLQWHNAQLTTINSKIENFVVDDFINFLFFKYAFCYICSTILFVTFYAVVLLFKPNENLF